ncbi:hypothetical protein [Methylorubrum zatmanii]|uniref:Uncharacterized protein n=1 Tax=Methylorubrum zatmanii TaxID=29429 RepID=A0ABW1WPQ8_9HYPH|nr:hypothetical protein [Methylorubrum zatmanii]
MIFVLIPPMILIAGGSALMSIKPRKALEIFLWCIYVITFLCSLYLIHYISLPHVVRTSTGRLPPTVGMILGEANALVGIAGILSIPVIFWMSHNGKSQARTLCNVLKVIRIFLIFLLASPLVVSLIRPIVWK